MFVHNIHLLRYARQKNAHLPHVNSAFLTSQALHPNINLRLISHAICFSLLITNLMWH